MQENDLVLMSLIVFMPTVFAVGLLFFPKGKEEWMRWWGLLGTALTLGLSLWMFNWFRAQTLDVQGKPLHVSEFSKETKNIQEEMKKNRHATTLEARTDKATSRSNEQDPADSGDWIARNPWIEPFQIEYFLGVDGISMAMILLTTALSFLAMIASWTIDKMVRGYLMLFLILETGMLGCFFSLDFFLFFIFWEVMLLPMYFLIGVWGGPRREYAAIKFFLYTLLGSAFILLAILAFYFTDVRDFKENADQDKPVHTFDLILLAKVGREASKIIDERPGNKLELAQKELAAERAKPVPNAAAAKQEAAKRLAALEAKEKRLQQPFFSKGFQYTMFLLLFVGFAIKLPMVPFHTWLPDAHVEAPTPISMILAGVLLKLGGYGIIRIAYPICPWAAKELAWYIALFGVINLVYGAFAAMAQSDFKKLVAYSSVSHMGYVILGIAVWPDTSSQFWAWGMNGAMYQMIAHGVSSAGMFFMVGVIYERAHHRNLDNFRGLYEPMPVYGGMSAIIFFAALGLPGLCGFVGEFMVVLATWNFSKVFAILAALTVVITAGYVLWTIQRVFMGTNAAYKNYQDMTLREMACAVPLVLLCVLLGIMPMYFVFSWMEPSVTGLVDSLYQLTAARS